MKSLLYFLILFTPMPHPPVLCYTSCSLGPEKGQLRSPHPFSPLSTPPVIVVIFKYIPGCP